MSTEQTILALKNAFAPFVDKWKAEIKNTNYLSEELKNGYLKDCYKNQAIGMKKVLDDLIKELNL